MTVKPILLAGAALLALATPAIAQDSGPADPPRATDDESAGDPVASEDIIVTGRLFFRNRTDDPNPVLSYDLEYFQRFEPVSVGEMLKRVPGATFTSDVLEYDAVQFRGLPPGFTQVLINGRRTPGGEADRSFFVDRIPAELVERIEIVRAPRADQPSEGIAGTLNIVTKESATFEGGFAKAGALINEDGEIRPSAAIAYAGELGEGTTGWAAVNYQERRNPKKKVSVRFSGEFDEFDDTELQDDTRDGSDLSANAEITHRFAGGGRVRLSGFIVDTDRDEDEVSRTFEGDDADATTDDDLVSIETQAERISQQTYALNADAEIPIGPGALVLAAAWNAYREETDATVVAEDIEEDEIEEETESLDIDDDEYSGTVSYTLGDDALQAKAGFDLLFKTRDGANLVDGEAEAGAVFSIDEDRYDPYVRVSGTRGAFGFDAGLRYEITRRNVTGTDGSARYEDETLNPSLHLRFSPTADDQFRASLARTVRRPNYDLISPYEQEETPGDEDVTIGNPALENERAWGIDVGYERRIGRGGIVGVNLFYRDISDLSELVAIDDVLDDEGEAVGNVYTPLNIGDGETWGAELDLSAPLDIVGLPDTGLFANYTYLDSSVRDPFSGETRRFNNQPHHVYNAGFIQTVNSVDASFGASVSGRSGAREVNLGETIDLTYNPDLEAFIEKRFGRNFVLRLTASNLLDRTKRERFRSFDGDSAAEILENQAAGDVDESEAERERAGRLFQVTLRAAF